MHSKPSTISSQVIGRLWATFSQHCPIRRCLVIIVELIQRQSTRNAEGVVLHGGSLMPHFCAKALVIRFCAVVHVRAFNVFHWFSAPRRRLFGASEVPPRRLFDAKSAPQQHLFGTPLAPPWRPMRCAQARRPRPQRSSPRAPTQLLCTHRHHCHATPQRRSHNVTPNGIAAYAMECLAFGWLTRRSHGLGTKL